MSKIEHDVNEIEKDVGKLQIINDEMAKKQIEMDYRLRKLKWMVREILGEEE